jgi:chromosomal replication initiator protein
MINPFDIIKEVENLFHLPSGAILKHDRKPRVSEARGIAMVLVRELCHASYAEVSDYFNRDHSTVIFNCKKIEKLRNNKYKSYLNNVMIETRNNILGKVA